MMGDQEAYEAAFKEGYEARAQKEYTPQQQAVMAEAPSLTQWMEEVDEVVKRYLHSLRGELEVQRLIPGTKEFETVWEEKGRKMLTEDGIQVILGAIYARVNKIAFLSHLSTEEVAMRCKLAHMDLAEEISNNRLKWEIHIEDRDTIIHNTMDIIYIALKKCVEGREKTFLERIFGERFASGRESEKKKEGYFSLGGL